jgi:hypothetical protein
MSYTLCSIVEGRVGLSTTSIAVGDSAGVVLCDILFGIDSIYWLVSLANSGIVAIFFTVGVLGRGIPEKVFLDMVEVIANGEGGSTEVFVVYCANQYNDECRYYFVKAVLSWD